MARLPRLSLAGEAHLVYQRGHNGHAVFLNDDDSRCFLDALRQAVSKAQVAVHGYALVRDRLWLLVTPPSDDALGRAMQAVSRRYSLAFNRAHSRTGTLWDGRFRSTVVEGGAPLLDAMVFVDQVPVREGLVDSAPLYAWSSARHHVGSANEAWLADAPDYWSLGNTPFERAAAYSRRVDEALPQDRAAAIGAAAQKSWVIGSPGFMARVGARIDRPLAPRPRGRPRRQVR
jgi:putative transposase